MKRNRVICLLLCLVILPTVSRALAGDDGANVSLADIPQVVKAAFRKAIGGKTYVVQTETEDGVTVYEAVWNNGANEIEVTDTGHTIETSKTIAVDDLPPAVAAAAKSITQSDKKLNIERKTIVVYEIETEDEKSELSFTADGAAFGENDDDE